MRGRPEWLFRCWLLLGGLLAASQLWAADITPAARKDIVVSPPAKDEIVVPEQYRGLREEKDKLGKPYTADFTAEYRAGFLAGWDDFLEEFQQGDFDLEEAKNPARFPDGFGQFVQTRDPSSFGPGQVAGMAACRDELLAQAEKRGVVFLPARSPWRKKFIALGGSDPGSNEFGNPTGIHWYHTANGRKIRDDDLKVLDEVSLVDVKRLSLTFTEITDAGVASLPAMPRLTHLELTGKNITGACFRTLDRFPQLVSLEVVGPGVTSADDLAAVRRLPALESISICAVEIDDDAIPVFLALPKLKDLRLNWAYDWSRGAKLSSGAIARLGGCSQLILLDLSGCAVDGAALGAIAESLHGLSSLSLAGTQITDESMSVLKKLPKLEWLRLSHTQVTDAGVAALASHPAIKTLLLDDTGVSDKALAALSSLPNLQEISVRRGQFSAAAIAAFKKLKPGAFVTQYN